MEILFRLIRDGKVAGFEYHQDWGAGLGISIFHGPPNKDGTPNVRKTNIFAHYTGVGQHPDYIEHDRKDMWTGLEDKNGRKIFENDKLKYSRLNKRGKQKDLGDLIHVGKILFDSKNYGFRFYYKFPSGGAYSSSLCFEDERFDINEIEVTGIEGVEE
jgi:hypothetical protein